MSIRRISLGTGYEYLLASVARGDGAVSASSPLTRYYAESGTPPGRFLGAGLAGLNDGAGIPAGTQVDERMLFHLLGMLADPNTGRPLGRPPRCWPASLSERIQARTAALPTGLIEPERVAAFEAVEAEEREREGRIARPVAGFDLTFSVPKSVSAAWGVADATTQAAIYTAHQDAIGIALAWAEQNVLFSRSGRNGVVQEPIRGAVAAGFDHWDSRAGDPHLHTHLVIANRAQTMDGTWRTLDSKTLYRYVVALSELHEGVLQDVLTARLGYGWDERARRHSRVPRHDITGVSEELVGEFSRRSADIEAAKNTLVERFVADHGRHPTDVEVLRLRQQATLATRPDKQHRSLAALCESWRERARPFVDGDPVDWVADLRERNPLPALQRQVLTRGTLRDAALIALAAVSGKRATFGKANVLAEVHRQLHGARFAHPAERLAIAEAITRLALDEAIPLNPPDADGTLRLRHRGADRYTTRDLLDAETRLLDAGRATDGPSLTPAIIDAAEAGGRPPLGADQRAAVTAIATSGRVLDVLVGPAGSGKTASLTALRTGWEDMHGPGTVIGLAPSAAAAEVLAAELGIDTENTAKWLHETARQPDRIARIHALHDTIGATTSSASTVHARRLHAQLDELHAECDRWRIHPEQLVLIDEAGLAGTRALDQIVTQARHAEAKVLLVGDWAQLGAIEAGGAFAMLVRDRPDAPELSTVRRFQQQWERDASVQLRTGDPTAIATYTEHDRVRAGTRDQLLDQLYTAWRDDIDHGHTSLMIAGDLDAVTQLNLRAHADRVSAGHVHPDSVDIAGRSVAGVGDRIVTRHNDRRLAAGRSWVKNGDTWTVHSVHADGSLTVQRDTGHGTITLPAAYVREHVELGYAATAFRAQGGTVDTAHALVSHTGTREALYVAATRGRRSNTLYVDTTTDPDESTSHGEPDQAPAEQILEHVLQRTGADTSAHETLQREQARRAREAEAQTWAETVIGPSTPSAAALDPSASIETPGRLLEV